MTERLLIANRGEIAVRISRACRDLGISPVAVFSDADRASLHVRLADHAIRIGPAPARESYLLPEKLIDAAKRTGARLVHPGFGFLAENAAFARAVRDAGLAWVGPDPESIDAMGSKTESRARMKAAGVPIVPGMTTPAKDPEEIAAFGREHGFPLLLKASAGGGGKGMRIVRADVQNQYIGPHWQDTGGSTYDSFEVLSSRGRTFRGAVSIDANMAASDQLPTWTADELRHAGIMTCFGSVNDNYIAMFSVAANQFQLIKQVSNVETVLAKRSLAGLATLTLGTPYVLEIMADGANVVASILTEAGVLIDTVTVADTSFSSGGTGFHVFAVQASLHWLEME